MENIMKVSQKIKNRITTWCSNSTSGYLSEENENTNFRRCIYLHVHCSIMYNIQDTKVTTSVLTKRWIGKDDVEYIYNEMLFSHKKNEILTFVTT